MSDYISRDAAISIADEAWSKSGNVIAAQIWDKLQTLPSADVEPVRHGRWEWIGGRSWRCSECEWIHGPNKPRFHYCPNCGARMDGEDDG